MFENDWLSRQIEIVSRSLSMLLFNKDIGHNIVSEEAKSMSDFDISEEILLSYMLKKYIYEGKNIGRFIKY